MDRDPVATVEFEHDDLEQVAGPVGAEQQRPARLAVALFEGVTDNRLLDRVADVLVGDAVLDAARWILWVPRTRFDADRGAELLCV